MIDPAKGSGRTRTAEKDLHIAMENDFRLFIEHLQIPTDNDGIERLFIELVEYIRKYDRILYSTISSVVYSRYDNNAGKENPSDDPCHDMRYNLEKLLNYIEDPDKMSLLNEKIRNTTNNKRSIEDAKKTVYKIYDHASLALQQYSVLKQTDEEYKKKFKQNIQDEKSDLMKEMNTQMITMVGIFTALAFLIFGSISSLDGIFENIQFPIFKVISIGLIWGICISNMIFVFLYCVGKMTNLNFKANENKDASIFQKYPVVWWTNLILFSLLMLSLWAHYIVSNAPDGFFFSFVYDNPKKAFFIGFVVIIAVIAVLFHKLSKITKNISD